MRRRWRCGPVGPWRWPPRCATSRSLPAVRRLLSVSARRRLRRLGAWPPVGSLRLGSLRRVTPISRNYGFDRGTPIDRHYIERFLTRHAGDVRGRVLEVGDDEYTRRFGGERVDAI